MVDRLPRDRLGLVAVANQGQAAAGEGGAVSKWRGHEIVSTDGVWVYTDTGTSIADWPDRPCGHCGLANTLEGHDGCLGTLAGVVNACCGHGAESEAYIQYEDGTELRGGRESQQEGDQVMTLEELLRMTVPAGPGCVASEDTPTSPDFRVAVQRIDDSGVHIIVHADGHDSETLDFIVNGDTLIRRQ